MNDISIKDFFEHKYIHDLKLSPDSKKIAFYLSQMSLKENTYEFELWIYSFDKKEFKKLDSKLEGTKFIWHDAKTLLTLTKNSDKRGAEVCRLDIDSGVYEELTTVESNIKTISSIDESNYLVTASYDNYFEDYNYYENRDEDLDAKYMDDYYVFDELPFWHDEKGITNKIRNMLYILNIENSIMTPITDRYMDVQSYELLGERLIILGKTIDKTVKTTSGIYEYNLNTKEMKQIVDEDTYNISQIKFLEDEIVFIGTDMKQYGIRENMQLFTVAGGVVKQLTNFDLSIKSAVNSDSRYKKGQSVKIYGDKLYFVRTKGYDSQICRVDSNGKLEEVTALKGSYDDFEVLENGIVFIGMKDMGLQELYFFSDKYTEKLSSFNDDYVQNKNIVKPEKIVFESDGYEITGFVMKPIDFDIDKKYPGVLFIHGGPNSVYGEVYYHDMQCMANAGYFVFFTNPHGSAGQGDEFGDLRGKYGSIDYEDLMNFTDAVLKKYKNIDEDRLGVTGGSYGGFMTNWIIGHTDRFKCAISEKGISNWTGKFATTDIGTTTNVDQQASDPWSDHEKMWFHSPMKYADRVVTPTLFIHGEKDYRCWYLEGIEMYSALMYHGVESKLYVFRNENHGYNRTGKPKIKVKRLEVFMDWFNSHLK